jgi:short-subunit dehydrogenase
MKNFVLITGASQGLGKSFVLECAKRKMDILMVSLPFSGLPELKKFVEENFEVFIDYLEIDLTDPNSSSALIEYIRFKEYPVSILINNAGLGGNFHFESEDFTLFDRMIQLNIKALTQITHGMIPILEKRPISYILNVSSMSIYFAGPYKQVYGATKSFIFYFSNSLSIELAKKNIHVSVLCPSGINSNQKMIKIHEQCNYFQKISILDPDEVAKYSIKKTLEGKTVIIPGKIVNLYFLFSKLIPSSIKRWMINSTNQRLIRSQNNFKEIPKNLNHT